MKKLILILTILILFSSCGNAFDCSTYCINPDNVVGGVDVEGKSSSNALKKLVEFAISKDINKEFNASTKVNLDIFSLSRLKSGEFKKLKITSPNLNLDGMKLSNFFATTICPYNKVVYKNKRIYYPAPLPLAYTAEITNSDLNIILNSQFVKNGLETSTIKINGHKVLQILQPNVIIRDSKIYLEVPVKTFLTRGIITLNLIADVEVSNNEILLNNITFPQNSNIIIKEVANYFKNNPISLTSSLDSKYCRVHISTAKVEGDVIKSSGFFIINKDYGG